MLTNKKEIEQLQERYDELMLAYTDAGIEQNKVSRLHSLGTHA